MKTIDDIDDVNEYSIDMDVIYQVKKERSEYSEETIKKYYILVKEHTPKDKTVMSEDVISLLDSNL
jgi:hypothetical protein